MFVILMAGAAITGLFAELFTLFLLVLAHEIGHVLAARYFGWTVREVKLLPFGGVAEVEEAGAVPAREEALVAIAGPLQNVWLGLLALGLGEWGVWDRGWAEYVWQANALIGAFNLLPIHPLDGGKIMQAALSYTMNYYKVMQWTMRISLGGSIVVLGAAIAPVVFFEMSPQLNLLIIGCFLLISNLQYAKHIPFLFLRFLIYREKAAAKALESGSAARPLLVNGSQSILSVARLFKREEYHLIYLLDPTNSQMNVIPEQRVVEDCLQGGNPYRAVSELFK